MLVKICLHTSELFRATHSNVTHWLKNHCLENISTNAKISGKNFSIPLDQIFSKYRLNIITFSNSSLSFMESLVHYFTTFANVLSSIVLTGLSKHRFPEGTTYGHFPCSQPGWMKLTFLSSLF